MGSFEYKLVSMQQMKHVGEIPELEIELNGYGRDGWECVGLVRQNFLLFKKALPITIEDHNAMMNAIAPDMAKQEKTIKDAVAADAAEASE